MSRLIDLEMVLACHFTKSSKGQFSETDRSDQNNNKKTKTKIIQKTFFLIAQKQKKHALFISCWKLQKKKNVQISFYFLISFLRKSGKVYYNPKPLYFRLYDITKVINCNKMIIVFTEFLLLCSRCCKFASAAYLIWFFIWIFFLSKVPFTVSLK